MAEDEKTTPWHPYLDGVSDAPQSGNTFYVRGPELEEQLAEWIPNPAEFGGGVFRSLLDEDNEVVMDYYIHEWRLVTQ
jgi:hypothetical protein